jgi:hypothetical protein
VAFFSGWVLGLVWDGVGCIHGVRESKLVGNFYLLIHFFSGFVSVLFVYGLDCIKSVRYVEAARVPGGGIEGSKKWATVKCVRQSEGYFLGGIQGVGDVCIYSSLLV